MLLKAIGKLSTGICSLAFGVSAGGFIIALLSHFGLGEVNSPTWEIVLLYCIAVIIGLNTAYRMWCILGVYAPKGLQLLFNKNSSAIETSNNKLLELTAIVVSILSGFTYGGLAYLGCSHLLHIDMQRSQTILGLVIIGSNIIANGAVFSYAWLHGLRTNTLFPRQIEATSYPYKFAEVFSSILALFGLGCIMGLGSVGLVRSLSTFNDDATLVGSTVAIIGFLGEAPFAISQGRLFVAKILKTKSPCLASANDNNVSLLNQVHAPSKNKKRLNYANTASLIIFAGNSFCGTYTDIGNFSVPIRLTFALCSVYLSFVSCLK